MWKHNKDHRGSRESYPALVPHPVLLLLLEERWIGAPPTTPLRQAGAPPPPPVSHRLVNWNFSASFSHRSKAANPLLFLNFLLLSHWVWFLLFCAPPQSTPPTAPLVYTFNSSPPDSSASPHVLFCFPLSTTLHETRAGTPLCTSHPCARGKKWKKYGAGGIIIKKKNREGREESGFGKNC